MPIRQADAPCWVLAPEQPRAGDPDEHDPDFWHWPTEEIARKHASDYGDQAVTPRQVTAPCWHVTCDGDCGVTLDEEDEYSYCFGTAAQAEDCAAGCKWKTTGDGRVFCEEDAPDCATADLRRLEQIPGQLVLLSEEGSDHG